MLKSCASFCALFSLVFPYYTGALQCKDDNDNPVDWFYVYKLPKVEEDTLNRRLLYTGEAYAYMTSDEYGKWIISNESIIKSSSIIANTLKPLYSREENIFSFLYNDEPPNEPKDSEKGHTKGVILGDETGGLWLVHSAPQFPDTGSQYAYPSSALRYGQSFLCISLDLEDLNKVGLQLQYSGPHIYQSKVPHYLQSTLENLVEAASGEVVAEPPWYHETDLSSGGIDFTSFAKSKNFNGDLYTDLVAVELKSDLLVETWLNGRGRLASDCNNTYSVKNVESLRIKDIKFRSSLDHSKWAVSNDENKFWICVGDINREEHQESRGGGTVCINNKKIARAYRNIVLDIEECSNKDDHISYNAFN